MDRIFNDDTDGLDPLYGVIDLRDCAQERTPSLELTITMSQEQRETIECDPSNLPCIGLTPRSAEKLARQLLRWAQTHNG